MLTTLQIKNYILIDALKIDFASGLNIFTGETGAGKSIIFDAIGILLGEKVSPAVVRKGANQCSISGIFVIDRCPSVEKLASERGIDVSDGQIVIRREVDAGGRSRCFLNDEIVSVGFLSELGNLLVDIHGQHQHQSLLKLAFQSEFLDAVAGIEKELGEYRKIYSTWLALKAKLKSLNMSIQEKERLMDLYKFQINEIDSADIKPGDDEYINQMLPQMKNSSKLKALASEMWEQIYEGENSVITVTDKLRQNMEKLVAMGAPLAEHLDALNEVSEKLGGVKDSISDYLDSVSEFDEAKIDQLISKLDKLDRLKKKYGATIEAILEHREKISKELENLQMSDDIKKDVESDLAATEKNLNALALKLSKKRNAAAEKLASSVVNELKHLGMPKAKFSVRFEREASPTINGFDKIEFLFSANPGEDLKPLKEIISGGEMSRFMLALKTVEAGSIPVLIFDEVDAGLSGPMGQSVARKLSALSKKSQVIAITHLPQIAAFAERHFVVEKIADKNKTTTNIRILRPDEVVNEIARMLSGKEVTDSALRHAEELRKQALL